jgi:hypothetical protein
MDDHDAHNRLEGIVTGIVGLSETFVVFGISEHTTNYGLPLIDHPSITELIIPQSDVNLPFWVQIPLVGRLILREKVRWRGELDHRCIYG